MKRFCEFLLLTLSVSASASIANPACGDAPDAQQIGNPLLHTLVGAQGSIGQLPVIPATERRTSPKPQDAAAGAPAESSKTSTGISALSHPQNDAWRISTKRTTNQVDMKWVSPKKTKPLVNSAPQELVPDRKAEALPKAAPKVVVDKVQTLGSVPKVSALKRPIVRMSLQQRLKAKRRAKDRIRRVGFEFEELQEILKQHAESSKSSQALPLRMEPRDSEPSFEIERTYPVAAPPRPSVDDSPSDEVESVLDQLRQELRREIEQTERQNKSTEKKRESRSAPSVIPRSAPTTIKNAANSSLDLSLDLDDSEEPNDELEPEVEDAYQSEAPPTPDDPSGMPKRDSQSWKKAPWILDNIAEDDDYDPCEPYYCREMWECAGGRCSTWLERATRNFDRTMQVMYGRCNPRFAGGTGAGIGGTNYSMGRGRALCRPAFGSTCNVGIWRNRSCRSGNGCQKSCNGKCSDPATCKGCVSACTSSSCTSSSCTSPAVNSSACTSSACTSSDPCTSCTTSCGSGCTSSGGCGGCPLLQYGEPWSIWGAIFENEPRIKFAGWTSAGYHSRANGRFNDHPDSLNVHQSWLSLERVADTTCKNVDWGFRFDAMYGVDAQQTQAFGGRPGSWDYQNGLDFGRYGWAVPQAYGELAIGNTSVMIGHFYTIMGYEVVPAPDNFFYSHSMSMFLSEPFTHTGVLASTKVSDTLEAYYGWTLGWDTGFDQPEDGNSFLGGFKVQPTDRFSATYVTTAGDLGWRGKGYAHSIVLAANPTDKLGVVVQSDLLRVGAEDNVGVSSYVFRDFGDIVSVGSRVEWWKGDNVTGYAPFDGTLPATGSFSYYGATFGANVRVGSNITVRPEGRIDWSPALGYSVGTGGVDFVVTY